MRLRVEISRNREGSHCRVRDDIRNQTTQPCSNRLQLIEYESQVSGSLLAVLIRKEVRSNEQVEE